jgi:hypothetical protein
MMSLVRKVVIGPPAVVDRENLRGNIQKRYFMR